MSPMREPVQTRSRQRVDRIVQAMEGLLRERAFEEVTIRDIALAAEVPTGTIYQFFDGKDDLMEHVAIGIEGELDRIVDHELTPVRIAAEPGQAVARLIAAIDEMQQAHSGFLCLAKTDPSAGSIGALAERLRQRLRDHLDARIAQAFPQVEPEARRGVVLVLTAFMITLFGQAPAQEEAARATFMAEASHMLAIYLRDRLTR